MRYSSRSGLMIRYTIENKMSWFDSVGHSHTWKYPNLSYYDSPYPSHYRLQCYSYTRIFYLHCTFFYIFPIRRWVWCEPVNMSMGDKLIRQCWEGDVRSRRWTRWLCIDRSILHTDSGHRPLGYGYDDRPSGDSTSYESLDDIWECDEYVCRTYIFYWSILWSCEQSTHRICMECRYRNHSTELYRSPRESYHQ